PLADAERVDWGAVETARVSFDAAHGTFDDMPANPPPSERLRQQAILRFFDANDAAGAADAWSHQHDGPRDLIETRMLAGIEAQRGSDAALEWIARIRPFEPGESDALLALLRWRQERNPEAADALRQAFVAFRTDPWVMQQS